MGESNTRRVVMLGKTGSGKSSLANTIFGEKLFMTSDNFNSETSRCEAQTRSVHGRSLTLIDTPGFYDTERPEEVLKPVILKCIIECAPGPHAFLIVLKVERFTEQEKAVINKIIKNFSEEAFKYAVVLFTHGDQLPEGKKIEDIVNQNKSLKDLVKKCGNRCHVIDNKYWNGNGEDQYRNNQFQVEQILKTIDEMKENQERCYTNEMLQAVQEEIKQEEETIQRESSGNMSRKEIRRRAKASVFNRLLIRAAGVTTGALIGALCGVGVMVAAVNTGLKMSAKAPLMKDALKLTAGAAAVMLSSRGSSGGAAGEAAVAAVAGAAAGEVAVAGAAAGEVAGAAAAVAAGEVAVAGAAAGEVAVAGAAAAVAAGEVAVAGATGAAAGEVAVAGAAAAGEAAGGTLAAAAGNAVAALTITAAGVGAVVGGVGGYYASEEAETPWQAVKMTAGAVKDDALCVYNSTVRSFDRIQHPQSGQDGKPK